MDSKPLLLTETGVAHHPDGSIAVNVGPIVRALEFLTEGRGEDRGTDEAGSPLPDLMSLAFDVIQSIIVGGRKADYFRQVKLELETRVDEAEQSSLALAKQAKRVQARAVPTALDHAADSLKALLADLQRLPLGEQAMEQLAQALDAFRSFGADRWVSASAQLLLAISAVRGSHAEPTPRRPRARAKPSGRATAKQPSKRLPKPPKRQAAPARKAGKAAKAKPKRR